MTHPDPSDLAAFVAVAEVRSFRGAAQRRGVSASSLSDAIRRLEERLGIRLLNRTTRSVTATEAGTALLARLRPALAEIAAALESVDAFRESPHGTLRLNVPTFVAQEVLPPIVGPFLSLHPGVRLDVTAEDAFVDVLAAGYDAGIRYGESLERDMIAVPIGPRRQRFVLAAAPAYLAAHGTPLHPRDLLDHACIRHRFASGALGLWEFERDGEVVRVNPEARLTASSIALERAAAEAGHGLISTFEEFLRPSLARGALVPVLPEWWQTFPGPFLYFPSRRLMPAPLRAFVDFVRTMPA